MITAGIVVLGLYDRDPAQAPSADPGSATPGPAQPEFALDPAPEDAVPAAAPDTISDPVSEQPSLPVAHISPDPHRSPLADRLNSPDTSIADDLGIVRNILSNYVMEIGANPVGSNREITAQLSGRNSSRHAPLPDGHSAISAEGELVDRWGTPFFFHAMSAQQMSIRSAGPDRELYTDDDAEWSPMPAVVPSPDTERVITAALPAAAGTTSESAESATLAETASTP